MEKQKPNFLEQAKRPLLGLLASAAMMLPAAHAENKSPLSQDQKSTLAQSIQMGAKRGNIDMYKDFGYQCVKDPACEKDLNTITNPEQLVEYANLDDLEIVGGFNLREVLILRYVEKENQDIIEHFLNQIPKAENSLDDIATITGALMQTFGNDQNEYKPKNGVRYDFTRTLRMLLTDKMGDCEDSSTALVAILNKRGFDSSRVDYSRANGHSMVGIKFKSLSELVSIISHSKTLQNFDTEQKSTNKWYHPDSKFDGFQIIAHNDGSVMLVLDPTSINRLQPEDVSSPANPMTAIDKVMQKWFPNRLLSDEINPLLSASLIGQVNADLHDSSGVVNNLNYITSTGVINNPLYAKSNTNIKFAGNLHTFLNPK